MPNPDFQPLVDGDHERFGPARAQINVWAAGQGRVELTIERPLIVDGLDLEDVAHWLITMVKPSIESINASMEEEQDVAAE